VSVPQSLDSRKESDTKAIEVLRASSNVGDENSPTAGDERLAKGAVEDTVIDAAKTEPLTAAGKKKARKQKVTRPISRFRTCKL